MSDDILDFEKFWCLLRKIEGEVVSTFATRKRRRYRIVQVLPGGVIRQAEGSAEPAQEVLVGKDYFKRIWERLARVGVCGMEERHAGFVAACLTALPGLDVWYANTGKGWDYRTLLVLGNPASGSDLAAGYVRKPREWDRSRIVAAPAICGGSPTIKGTRIMVGNILGMFAGGYQASAILEAYPRLSMQDVEAALEYSRVKVDREPLVAGS